MVKLLVQGIWLSAKLLFCIRGDVVCSRESGAASEEVKKVAVVRINATTLTMLFLEAFESSSYGKLMLLVLSCLFVTVDLWT
jgi:hypothetical protein